MYTTSIKYTSKKYLHQYFDATMTEVRALMGFSKQGVIYGITEESISSAALNNRFILCRSPILVMVDSSRTHKDILIQLL